MAAYQKYVPVHMQSFHSVVSPITPVHSPHQSLSSTPSRTPVHTLTLHEYRKQQNTPSPLTASPGKSLKRKAAALRLSFHERVPLVQSSSPLGSTRLVTSSPRQRVQTLSSPSSDHASRALQPQTPATSQPNGSQGLLTSQRPPKVLHFKTSKRLPKPLPFPVNQSTRTHPSTYPLFPAHSVPSPPFFDFPPRPWIERSSLSATSSTDHLHDSAGVKTASTVSLTRFPYPPRSIDALSARHSPDLSFPQAQITITTTTLATPPATPVTLHYRGTSFDLINPHNSLSLHDLVTPGEQDPDVADYFPILQSTELLKDHEDVTTAQQRSPTKPRMAPQKRPVYDDYRSAHKKIVRPPPDVDQKVGAPTQPPRAFLSPPTHNPHRPDSPYYPHLAPPPLNIQKQESLVPSHSPTPTAESRDIPVTTPSIRNRVSRFFTKPTSKVKRQTKNQEYGMSSNPRASGISGRRLSQNNQSAPEISGLSSDSVEEQRARGGVMSDAALHATLHADDQTSVYSDEENAYQHSVWGASMLDRECQPHGYRMRQIDYTDEVDLDAYEEFGTSLHAHSARTSTRMSRGRLPQEFTTGNTEKTDTLSKIIDGYGNETSELSRVDSVGGNSSRQPLMRVSSSIAKLDFGLERPSISNYSDVPAPRSPSRGNMYTRGHARFQGPGSPPGFSPPPGPPSDLRAPHAPFAGRALSSAILSGESSYGDTGNLLGLSQVLSKPSDVPNVPQWLGPFASSTTAGQKAQYADSVSPAGRRQSLNPFLPGFLEPSSSYSQESGETSPLALAEAERIFDDTREEARKASGDIPLLWRNTSMSGASMPKEWEPEERTSPGKTSFTGLEDDWETVGENSRSNLQRSNTDDSIADYSSRNASFEDPEENTARQVLVHPGSASMPHTYKMTQLESGESALVPVYAGARAMTTNALPRLPSTPYRHPSPINEHPHPLSSPPPLLSGSRTEIEPQARIESYAPFAFDDYLNTTPTAGTHRDDESDLNRPPARMGRHQDDVEPAPAGYQLSEKETAQMLDAGPNEEILYSQEQQYSSSHYTDSRSFSSGRAEPPTRHELQAFSYYTDSRSFSSSRAEPPTTSTLAANRDDSFAKLTILGPKGNLTGTPLGTGMHEVGSSIADTSSPGAAFFSTPKTPTTIKKLFKLFPSSPISRFTTPGEYQAASPKFPTAPYEVESHWSNPSSCTPIRSSHNQGAGSPSYPSPISPTESAYSTHGRPRQDSAVPVDLRPSVDAIQLQPLTRKVSHFPKFNKRNSVPNQTSLRELRLGTPETAAIFSSSRLHRIFKHEETAKPRSPLRLQTPLRTLAQEDSPHLLQPGRASTPILVARHNRLCWMIFAACCFFPPFLILYGVGFADGWMISCLSNGEFSRCGHAQKTVAFWVGTFLCIFLPVFIAVGILSTHGVF